MRITSEYNLGKLYAELSKEWHPTKNMELTPFQVTPGSHKKVWWVCNQGHEWKATVNHRKNGRGCPFCAGKRVTNDNNLAVKYSELAREWHPTKNEGLTPFQVTPGSGKKVWWICNQGHEWETGISNRTRGRGCPFCAGQRATKDNNLAIKYPELIKEWHSLKNKSLTPYDVMPGSDKKVWWICSQGHEWKTTIYSRTSGTRCPRCYQEKRGDIFRQAILRKRKSLAEKNPEIAHEWHPTRNGELTPDDVTPGSNKKIWWRCDQGHEWKTTVNLRTRGTGCPRCYQEKQGEMISRAAVKKSGSLADKNPLLAKEWHPTRNKDLTPYNVSPKSHKNVWWICKRGHEWKATVANRSVGTGCPNCHPQSSRIEIRIYCEFKTIFNDVTWLAKIDGIECDIYLPQYKVGIELDGYPWHQGYEERDKQKGDTLFEKGISLLRIRDKRLKQIVKTDISYHDRERHITVVMKILRSLMLNISFSKEETKKISHYLKLNQLQNTKEYRKMIGFLPGPIPEKSLAKLFPKLANEWDFEKNSPLNPSMFTPKSSIKIWWKCSKGHEWKAVLASRTSGRGCPYCSGRKPTRENNLAVKNPELAKEWHTTKNEGLTPFQVTPGSGKKVWWVCSQGHEWKATLSNRTYNERGCPYCAGQRVTKDNNLAIKHPELAKQWHPTRNGQLTPFDVLPGSGRKVWWICNQGHEWEASLNNRTRGRGCPYCAGKKASKNYNLAIKHPELAKQWHLTKNGILTPYDVTPGSGKKVWWICNQGHEWEASLDYRTRGSGCPYCYRRRRLKIL